MRSGWLRAAAGAAAATSGGLASSSIWARAADDDSGQAWTAEYVDGFDVVARAVLPEALLWKDTYACVSLDGTSDDVVDGYLLGIPDPSKRLAWEAKLAQADQIEGFDPEDPVGGSLYQRAIVRAAVVNPDVVGYDGYDAVWAYVYRLNIYIIFRVAKYLH